MGVSLQDRITCDRCMRSIATKMCRDSNEMGEFLAATPTAKFTALLTPSAAESEPTVISYDALCAECTEVISNHLDTINLKGKPKKERTERKGRKTTESSDAPAAGAPDPSEKTESESTVDGPPAPLLPSAPDASADEDDNPSF